MMRYWVRELYLQHSVKVISKASKDHTLCAYYHPISLSSVDTKILTAVLGNLLQQVISFIIKNDQADFPFGEKTKARYDLWSSALFP